MGEMPQHILKGPHTLPPADEHAGSDVLHPQRLGVVPLDKGEHLPHPADFRLVPAGLAGQFRQVARQRHQHLGKGRAHPQLIAVGGLLQQGVGPPRLGQRLPLPGDVLAAAPDGVHPVEKARGFVYFSQNTLSWEPYSSEGRNSRLGIHTSPFPSREKAVEHPPVDENPLSRSTAALDCPAPAPAPQKRFPIRHASARDSLPFPAGSGPGTRRRGRPCPRAGRFLPGFPQWIPAAHRGPWMAPSSWRSLLFS